jgi:hypothetical protein
MRKPQSGVRPGWGFSFSVSDSTRSYVACRFMRPVRGRQGTSRVAFGQYRSV